MTETTRLHAYADECDTVIASSLEDALVVLKEYGVTEPDPEYWEQVDDAEEIAIHCDATGAPTEPHSDADAGVVTKTAAEWCARGRGFLCTTEY
jgi:hypothetical protein